jgi:beta-N-acetylhexosaminidase
MLCLGWSGEGSLCALNAQARECIGQLGAGGIILFGRNIQPQTNPLPPVDAVAVRAMIDEAQSLARIPLLVGTDQEGGRVARFASQPFTRMPSARRIGERGSPALARQAAWVTARELAAVGVNWNFAPVADIDSNPANPVIGDRSFGRDATTVAEFVTAQAEGYAEGGILACAKHFPGHGDTAVDSHFALPALPFDREAIDDRELIPFRAAIVAGVPSIMTAHITFPTLDPSGLPATLSHPVLTGLLRDALGFDGLIVTDSLEMRAVADGWGVARAAVLSAIAGADILLVSHSLDDQRAAHAALLEAAESGELPLARIDESVTRILAAKRRAFATPRPDLSVIGCEEHSTIRAAFDAQARPEDSGASTLGEEKPS